MYKKSLFLGAAGLMLLALCVFVGCSNPSSSDGGSAPQSGGGSFPGIPAGAVYTDDEVELLGLLNDFDAVTNRVRDIVFTEDVTALNADLTIPDGKTVYLNNASNGPVVPFTALAVNIIVEEGGRLVLLQDFETAGVGARLLVKGSLDVYNKLTTVALDVADYFIQTSGTIDAKGTVIGTAHVSINAGAELELTDDDIAPQSSPDRFTPAQAWAAAGQGHLTIIGSLEDNYKVADLLAGVYPSRSRRYTVETDGGGVLPALIPAGANIIAHGVIKDAEGHNLTVNGNLIADNADSTFEAIQNLTVNGSLIADAATFEKVVRLTISSSDTDNLASRVSVPSGNNWTGSLLQADSATLEAAENIIIGDYGEFVSDSTAIVLPPGAKITLGRSAIFNAAGTNTNSFDNLTSLFVGPASAVTILSPTVTFKSLESLTLQDSAKLVANAGTAVSFLVDASATPKKTEITLGRNVLYQVGVSPTAKVDVAIKNDSSLLTGSTLTVNPGSTFTLEPDTTLTVPTGAEIDFSEITKGSTTGPATPDLAPIQIKGTIEVTGSGSIVGPNPVGLTNATDVYKFIAFDENDGKVLLNYGTSFSTGALKLVGADSSASAFEWKSGGTDDGAQVEINAAGITIRDTPVGTTPTDYAAELTVGAPNAYILKEQILTLETGVELKVDDANLLWFAGDAGTSGGAQLKGTGKIVAGGTSISGGSKGWRVFGGDSIGIRYTSATASSIENSGTGATVFRAQGAGAVITQATGTTLTIGLNTAIELGGTPTTAWGIIVLTSGGAKLDFPGTSSKLVLGAGTGGTAAAGLVTLTIGGEAFTNAGLQTGDYLQTGGQTGTGGVLVQIGGTTAGSITTTAGDITLASNSAFVGTL
jgi:hypothetical protein